MIYTSYFAKMRKMTPEQKAQCVSIARFKPKGVEMPEYQKVAPAKEILFQYKQDGDQEAYTVKYMKQLEGLNPNVVAKDLNGKILCCYEKSSDFCHRHILAEWLKEYGYKCKELDI